MELIARESRKSCLEEIENHVPNDGRPLEETKESEYSHLGPVVLMDVGDNIGGGST